MARERPTVPSSEKDLYKIVSVLKHLVDNPETLATLGISTYIQTLLDDPDAVTAQATLGIREVLTANRTYYVRTDGSDSNTGLANTAGGAFLTVQKAIDAAATLIDLRSFTVTIQVADGTYSSAGNVLRNCVGDIQTAGTTPVVTIQGNSGTPTNVVISTSGATFQSFNVKTPYLLKDMALTSSGSVTIDAEYGGLILVSNLSFGATGGAIGSHMRAVFGATIRATGNYAVTAGGFAHWLCGFLGVIITTSRTITFSNSPAFTGATCYCDILGYAAVNGMTFTNGATVTGKRFNVIRNGVIDAGGGGANYVPGDAAGTGTDSGTTPWGLYV